VSVAILVPVLNRPANVAPLIESIRTTTPDPYRVLFICDPGDTAEQDAIAAVGGWMISPGGSYASKIRAGIDATDEPLLFMGADDLRFRPGWLEEARAMMPAAQVVGVNDGIHRPRRLTHATHFLMTREYAELPCIDGSPGPLAQCYDHSWVDDELIATATKRGVYAYAKTSRVKHLHPMCRTAADDATYKLGRARFAQDRKTFARRMRLWT
jgi:glycosyltransferase involved in cell wall biosynthesis